MIKGIFNKKGIKKAFAGTMAMAVLLSSGGFNNLTVAKAAVTKTGSEVVLEAEPVEVTKDTAAAGTMLSNEERGVIYANSRTDFRDETIYFLITTRFYDGDSSNNARTSEDTKAQNPESDPSWRGDFKGLIDKLDYIKALGFTAIWITPVVQNDSGYDYHGYHAYDFSAVDTRYESNGVTYQTLIDACHAKGIKVIQDVVFNHTCNWGEKNLLKITNEVYGGGRSNYVMPAGDSLDPENIYHHTGFCGGGDWDEFGAQYKTIADDCFDLNTENPKVYNYLINCYKHYIDMGVDGFRVDTVKHISRLTLNATFVPQLMAEAKKNGNDNFYMFGEICTKGHDVWYRGNPPISTCFYTWADDSTWLGRWSSTDQAANNNLVSQHYTAHCDTGSQPTSNNAFLNGNNYHTPDYSQASGMNAIDFQMHWSFNSANGAFGTALGEDRYFNDATWNVVYVDSHDYGPDECQTLRYNGGTDAWAENLSLMFTFRGIPCVYYGSEIEFQAGKPIDVGPNQPLANTGRAYYGDNIEGNVETVGFTDYGNLSGAVKTTLESTLSQHIMRLNRLRQAIPALRKGQYSTEGCSGNIAFKRRYTDSTTDSFALVAISGSATFSNLPGGTYVDAVTGDTKTVSEGGSLTANVSGKGNMKVYVLSTSKTPAPGRVIPNGTYLNDGGSATIIPEVSINQVAPTGITLSKSSVSVYEGKTATVTATVSPSNATNKAVTWTSSNSSVATVSGGVITGVSAGSATITASTVNGKKATVSVTVSKDPNYVAVTGISVSPKTVTLTKGDTESITATVTPSNATNKTVTWTTSDSSVATVSNGVITAKGVGDCTITATTSNGKTATVSVTVEGSGSVVLPDVPSGHTRVFFKNAGNWSTVNYYSWKKGTNDNVAQWPGSAMTVADSDEGIYYADINTTAGYNMVIFNGGGTQTDDLDIPTSGSNMYTWNGSWSTYTPPTPVTKGKVVVSYVDTNGTSIADSVTKTGNAGTSYTTSAKTISGYTLKTTPSNATGTYTSATISVKYIYTKNATTSYKPVITLTAGDKKITAKWSAISGVSKYRVFTYLNKKYTKVTDTTSTSYTITGLTNGTKYGVYVLAYADGAWQASDTSYIKYATPTGSSAVDYKPTPTLTAGDKQIKATWTKITGASKYRVFTYLNSKYTKVTETTSTTYTIKNLKNGTKYGVYVVAYVDGTWKASDTSHIKYATPKASSTTDYKPVITLTPDDHKITVTWAYITGATKYRVYTYINGDYTLMKETENRGVVLKNLSNDINYGIYVIAYVNGKWVASDKDHIKYATPGIYGTVSVYF